jgi:hypothetical protein
MLLSVEGSERGSNLGSEDDEKERKLPLSDPQATKGVRRPFQWISKHVEPMNITDRWISHSLEEGLATNEDFGTVAVP